MVDVLQTRITCEELCEHYGIGCAERRTRDSIKYKMVEFMGEHIGECYERTYIRYPELRYLGAEIDENHCGMMPMRDLDDDYYDFDGKNYCLQATPSSRVSTADPIRIKGG